jgi:hypothetical protein
MTTPGPTTASVLLQQLAHQLDDAHPGGERLRVLVEMRRLVEQEIGADALTMTRRHSTWEDVGQVLGVSRQAAWERYRYRPTQRG